MKPQVIIGIIVAVLIVAGLIWFAVTNPAISAELGLSHPSSSQSMASTTPNHYGGMRGGFATGSIEVLNDNGFTLSLQDGTTKVIALTSTSTLQNYASASSTPTTITSDQLSVGEQVLVMGSANADGSITARRVLTGTFPTMRGGFGRGQRTGSSTNANGTPVRPTVPVNGNEMPSANQNNSGGAPGMMTPPGGTQG